MKHRKRRRKNYLGTDKTIRINRASPEPQFDHGPLTESKHTKWKYGILKTMQELMAKNALNPSQIDTLAKRGIDIAELALKAQLNELDMESQRDLNTLAELARQYPDAIKMMSKIEKNRKNAKGRKETKSLKDRLRSLDLDKPEDVMMFAGIIKKHPEALDIMTAITQEENS